MGGPRTETLPCLTSLSLFSPLYADHEGEAFGEVIRRTKLQRAKLRLWFPES
jgi:hypothetical protein